MSILDAQQPARLGDQLYELLTEEWRDLDHTPREVIKNGVSQGALEFHHRFIRAYADALESYINGIAATGTWRDPARCPSAVLPYLAADSGWPLDAGLPESTQRLIVRHVRRMVYERRGNLSALSAAIEAFTGLPCRIWTYHGPESFAWVRTAQMPDGAGPLTGSGSSAPGQLGSVLQAAGGVLSQQLLPGMRVRIQHGGSHEDAVIASVVGSTIRLDRALLGQYPAGARLLIEPASGSLGQAALGWNRRWGIGGRQPVFDWNADDPATGWDVRRWGFSGQRGIAPSDRRLRFTFIVQFDATPTADQLRLIRLLCDYMKPSRDHYSLRYPAGVTQGFFRWGMQWGSAAWGVV